MKETNLGAVTMVASMWAVGCVANGAAVHSIAHGSGPEFPSQASLSEIASRPTAAPHAEDRQTLSVDDWQPAEPAEPSNDAEALAQSTATAKGQSLTLDRELSCAAREIGRFFAQHHAFPDQQLQAYMAGVCGATQATFGASVWSQPSAVLVSPANQKEWHDQITKQLGPWLPPSAKQLGAAELSDGKNTVFAVAVGQSDIDWEQRSTVADQNGRVVLSGNLRSPAAFIFGLSNVGANGQHDCQTDPRVAPPRFRISCELDAADSSAWVDLQALPPGRVLSHGIARVLVRREGTALGFSTSTKNTPPESVSTDTEFAQRLLTLINERRAQAQLPALALARHETETSSRLAAHYFAADRAGDQNDQIALGLMAGWDIQGSTIRNADFYSTQLSGSLDPRRWLSYMLEQPSARRVLLDQRARAIAIGANVQAESHTVGALINTYQFYLSDDHEDDVKHFLSRLNEHRKGLGLAPAKVEAAPEVAEAVQSVKTTNDPGDALDTAMHRVVERTAHGVEGYYIEATDVDHVTLPDALLRPQVTLAISAAHHRYPKAAWGTLTLLVLVLESSKEQRTAQAESRQHTE